MRGSDYCLLKESVNEVKVNLVSVVDSAGNLIERLPGKVSSEDL